MRAIDERELIRRISELPDLRTFSTATIGKCIKACRTVTIDDLRPKGRWVEGYPVTCSICGHSAETLYEDCNIYRAIRTPYCSYCGADMRGGGEDG